jgi:hypothetical protein
MRPVRSAAIAASIVALAFFCAYGGWGYFHLLVHQPPHHPTSGPLPPDTTGFPPWYALFIAAYLSIFWFAGTFGIVFLGCWIVSKIRRVATH